MSNKDLISVIEGLLESDLTEAEQNAHNKKAYDSVVAKQKEHGHSADAQGVVGGSDGNVLNAGGEEDVGEKGKGEFASDAADNSKEVGVGGDMSKPGGPVASDLSDEAPAGEKGKYASDASSEVEADQEGECEPCGVKEEEELEDEAVAEETVEEKCGAKKESSDDDEEAVEEAKDKGDMDKDGKDEPDSKEYMDNKDAAIKKAMKEEEELEETEGETLKKVSGEANREHRPEQEKGDNLPKTHTDTDPGKGPHDQSADKHVDDIEASKQKVACEGEELSDEDMMSEEEFLDYIETMNEEEIAELASELGLEEDTEQAVKDFLKRGGKIKVLKPQKTPKPKMTVRSKNNLGQGGHNIRSDQLKGGAYRIGDTSSRHSEEAELDEDFKEKAAIIFETTVNEKVQTIREEMEVVYAEKLAEEKEALNETVDTLVSEAVAEWIQENQLEIKYSLRTEIAENFIKGLKGLFAENYIEIPDEEVSVVDELTEAVESYKEQLEEQSARLEEANAIILENKKADVFGEVAEGLTETQKIKLEKLAASVVAEDIDEFEYKVSQLKESYFTDLSEQLLPMAEEVIEEQGNQLVEDSSMSHYASFLSKTVIK